MVAAFVTTVVQLQSSMYMMKQMLKVFLTCRTGGLKQVVVVFPIFPSFWSETRTILLALIIRELYPMLKLRNWQKRLGQNLCRYQHWKVMVVKKHSNTSRSICWKSLFNTAACPFCFLHFFVFVQWKTNQACFDYEWRRCWLASYAHAFFPQKELCNSVISQIMALHRFFFIFLSYRFIVISNTDVFFHI